MQRWGVCGEGGRRCSVGGCGCRGGEGGRAIVSVGMDMEVGMWGVQCGVGEGGGVQCWGMCNWWGGWERLHATVHMGRVGGGACRGGGGEHAAVMVEGACGCVMAGCVRGAYLYGYCIILLDQGPIVNDLGAMPVSDSAMPLVKFEQLLESIPSLRVMTISPHVDARDGYQRIQALLKRYH